jgi:hypothetical protein|tara:strand:+ start:499 stop:666 length:168 start_codon:yes stop_codon:yes gene_type:complete
MIEQKTFRKIITEKEFSEIIKYCEEQPVPYKFLKPILTYIQSIPNDIDNKDKKSK